MTNKNSELTQKVEPKEKQMWGEVRKGPVWEVNIQFIGVLEK